MTATPAAGRGGPGSAESEPFVGPGASESVNRFKLFTVPRHGDRLGVMPGVFRTISLRVCQAPPAYYYSDSVVLRVRPLTGLLVPCLGPGVLVVPCHWPGTVTHWPGTEPPRRPECLTRLRQDSSSTCQVRPGPGPDRGPAAARRGPVFRVQ